SPGCARPIPGGRLRSSSRGCRRPRAIAPNPLPRRVGRGAAARDRWTRRTPPSGHTRAVTSALLSDALAPLRADPARAAILSDIDGTLAPIVEHAADARVSEQNRQLLVQIARKYGVVACVSGRRASEARAMVSIGTIC